MNIQKLLSLLIALTGGFLLIFMILVEDEPGLIPLVMIASGIGWYIFIRNKVHSKNT